MKYKRLYEMKFSSWTVSFFCFDNLFMDWYFHIHYYNQLYGGKIIKYR